MNKEIRMNNLCVWLKQTLNITDIHLEPILGDASFRSYYRLHLKSGTSYIIMDAPPGIEDVQPFVAIAQAFAAIGVQVPHIFAADIEAGFLVLTDFGDRVYLQELTDSNATQLYAVALAALLRIQSYQPQQPLPAFDAVFMRRELAFFDEWFLQKHVEVTVPSKVLNQTFEILIKAATEQPQVCVHRDYHSRNLIVLANNEVGVLDFQDAVWGPLTYDAVSLLRDCYISWPRQRVEQWVHNFWQQSCTNNIIKNVAVEQYQRWFDLMGVQRHLKAMFIFARKYHRDGSANYLPDIPRGLNYVLEVSQHYPELHAFRTILLDQVAPKIFVKELVA